MENQKKNHNKLYYSLLGILLLVFGFYSTTTMYADAVSVASITFTAGTTTTDVDYSSAEGSDTHTAYVIGQNGGQAYAWKTEFSDYEVLFNVTLTGSTSARAIEWNDDTLLIYAVTNDKIFKLTQTLGIAGSFATGTANIIQELFYDTENEVLYYCTNDGYGSINVSTLVPTNLYSDPQTNAVLGCDFDILNGYAVLAGDDIGATFNCELTTVSLTSHTQVGCYNNGASAPFYSVCVDNEDVGSTFYWGLSSTNAIARKITNSMTLSASVTVGTTPRNCSITTDLTARRLYVANEGSDTISIVDIDANVVLNSPSVCDTVADRKIATHRETNSTNTFVTCNSNVNSIVIDNTVSDFIPPTPTGTGCDNPDNAMLLKCRLGENDGLGGVGQSVGNGIMTLGCNVIFVDCTDEDPQTNGIGLLAFIASIFVIIGMFYYTIGKDAFHMPIFIYIIIIVALSAFFTLTGIIDPVFLVLSIVAIIALAVPKVIGIIQNRGGGFSGGSTE